MCSSGGKVLQVGKVYWCDHPAVWQHPVKVTLIQVNGDFGHVQSEHTGTSKLGQFWIGLSALREVDEVSIGCPNVNCKCPFHPSVRAPRKFLVPPKKPEQPKHWDGQSFEVLEKLMEYKLHEFAQRAQEASRVEYQGFWYKLKQKYWVWT